MNEPDPVLLSEYDIIKSLNFSRSQEYREPVKDTLTVTLCDDIFESDEQTFEFYGVENLSIGYLGTIGGVHLYANDLSDRGYEEIKYEVTDSEEHTLSFYCTGYAEKK